VINLDGKHFSPTENSKGGRVASDAVFSFSQTGRSFTADYSGAGFTHGHLIGAFKTGTMAELVYHCRADDGALEAGEAAAEFSRDANGRLRIEMNWRWLNGSQKSGQSSYLEIL